MSAAGAEPGWVRHAIWWRLYPLGFVGAVPQPAAGPAHPGEHRLLRVLGWLDHAIELGASGIALGPIFASATHGYDTLDHYRIDPRLGQEDDFDELVAAAHARGLRVQLDGVFNHVARTHPLAQAALAAGPDSAAGRMLRTRLPAPGEPPGTLPEERSGAAPGESPGAAAEHAFAAFEGHDELLELNPDNPAVADLVVDVMRYWLDRGADAWRLDAAYRVPAAFWARVLPRVRAGHPDAWFEAEVIHGDYAEFVADSSADSVTQYELWKAVWSSLNDRNPHELAWALGRHNDMLDMFAPATFIGNHDVTRIASRLQDRRFLSHAVALLALLGGTPTIYAGDEYAFTGVKEERAGGDDAIRPEFPASPDLLDGADQDVCALYRRLLGIRRDHPWLHRAHTSARTLSHELLLLDLAADGCTLALALNYSEAPQPLPDDRILAADPATTPGTLAPAGWAVLEPGQPGA